MFTNSEQLRLDFETVRDQLISNRWDGNRFSLDKTQVLLTWRGDLPNILEAHKQWQGLYYAFQTRIKAPPHAEKWSNLEEFPAVTRTQLVMRSIASPIQSAKRAAAKIPWWVWLVGASIAAGGTAWYYLTSISH